MSTRLSDGVLHIRWAISFIVASLTWILALEFQRDNSNAFSAAATAGVRETGGLHAAQIQVPSAAVGGRFPAHKTSTYANVFVPLMSACVASFLYRSGRSARTASGDSDHMC